jgi:hypothetical protein
MRQQRQPGARAHQDDHRQGDPGRVGQRRRGHSSHPGLAAAESHATARKLVTLSPGAPSPTQCSRSRTRSISPPECGLVTADYLQIYPPNQTTPVNLRYRSQTCSKKVQVLTISVVQPGSGGQ